VPRLPSLSCLGLFLAVSGCTQPAIEVAVRQPMDFPHATHLTYFASGTHREEGIKKHLDAYDGNDLPPELSAGRCAECHEDDELLACGTCHTRFKNPALWSQKDIRKCVACHRGAWGAASATIPSAAGCLPCHEGGVRLVHAGEQGARMVLISEGAPGVDRPVDDVPWVRLNRLPLNVYFSHTAHVRYASMPCAQCHQDVTTLKSPPTLVRVFTMSRCLSCHAEKGASTDCLTCHK
jgi:hypothetical protein